MGGSKFCTVGRNLTDSAFASSLATLICSLPGDVHVDRLASIAVTIFPFIIKHLVEVNALLLLGLLPKGLAFVRSDSILK